MPPKAKFKKDEIVETALDLVRMDGMSALTARALGAKLGSSARPIFTVFESMEEVQQEVMTAAKKRYTESVERGLLQKPAFKGVGIEYILFAQNEPKLFQLLFMAEQTPVSDFSRVLPVIEVNYAEILQSIENEYGLDAGLAQKLYLHLWIYTHGIATLCVSKIYCPSEAEIGRIITEVFVSLLKRIKAGEIS